MTTLYMLDTDTVSYAIRGGAPMIDVRMRALHLANLRGVRAGAVVPH